MNTILQGHGWGNKSHTFAIHYNHVFAHTSLAELTDLRKWMEQSALYQAQEEARKHETQLHDWVTWWTEAEGFIGTPCPYCREELKK